MWKDNCEYLILIDAEGNDHVQFQATALCMSQNTIVIVAILWS
jgi:hypothetical protein